MPPSLRVHASTLEAPRRVCVVIGATSDGLPPESAARSPVDEFESGLGLAVTIARHVIEAGGGTLRAVSEPERFALLLEMPAA